MLNNLTEKTKQIIFLTFILICLLYTIINYFSPKTFIAKSNYNKLLIPNNNIPDTINFTIYKNVNLNDYSKDQIYQLRQDIVNQSGLTANYIPADVVFGRINSSHSWWSNYEHFISGIKKDYIPGESSDSRGILNPFLLLTPEFWSFTIWSNSGFEWRENIREQIINNNIPPMFPNLINIKLKQSEKLIEADYNVTSFMQEVRPFIVNPIEEIPKSFGISGYNARDFNMRFIQLKLDKSSNIKLEGYDNSIIKNIDYIGSFNKLCYHDKPCNSRMTKLLIFDKMEFQLPAVAEFWMWQKEPTTTEVAPDLAFKIKLY
jgi:hypothetical protein